MKPLFSTDAAGNVIARERSPAEERDLELHSARAYLSEAMRRRAMGRRGFALTLLGWAANARRRAAAIDMTPPQGDLFGAVS